MADSSVDETKQPSMQTRPLVEKPTEYGNAASFWVEYPSGLVDLTRSTHLAAASGEDDTIDDGASDPPCMRGQLDVAVDGARTVRFDAKSSALVVIDMQNFFLHPDLRDHPKGLACVQPLLDVIPPLRTAGVKIIWVNWGLTEHELQTIPPSLVRGFMKNNTGGLGSELQGGFGRKLMRDAYNSELYGPLQAEYVKGKEERTDVWIHKNRMSALWGPQSSLDLYLQEEGINTLFFSGVNADQCVLGTVVDSYYRGYDIVLIKDATATTSPAGGLENIYYNIGNSYGFLSDSVRVAEGALRK